MTDPFLMLLNCKRPAMETTPESPEIKKKRNGKNKNKLSIGYGSQLHWKNPKKNLYTKISQCNLGLKELLIIMQFFITA